MFFVVLAEAEEATPSGWGAARLFWVLEKDTAGGGGDLSWLRVGEAGRPERAAPLPFNTNTRGLIL